MVLLPVRVSACCVLSIPLAIGGLFPIPPLLLLLLSWDPRRRQAVQFLQPVAVFRIVGALTLWVQLRDEVEAAERASRHRKGFASAV